MKKLLIAAAAFAGCGFSAMPVDRQNALVQQYCAVCHSDAHMNGGISLEHFDAAHPDPGVAAMMVSKLKGKAMGAAGIPLPDRTTQDALLNALLAEAADAGSWTVNRAQNPATHASILTASIVREAPSTASAGEPDLYRLKLTCDTNTHEPEMQLAWSPGVPETGRVMSGTVDGKTPFTYKVEGREKMANGSDVTSGPGAVNLHVPWPAQTLTVGNLFPNETVVFPFDSLTPELRRELSACFSR